jgi:formylmethanofuran dehydrogenase subunit D
MGLREYLYPALELKLILARSLEVDAAAAAQGTLAKAYQDAVARVTLSPRDAQRLGLEEGAVVQLASKSGQVIVRAHVNPDASDGLAVMAPSSYASALLGASPPYQGVSMTVKAATGSVTPLKALP